MQEMTSGAFVCGFGLSASALGAKIIAAFGAAHYIVCAGSASVAADAAFVPLDAVGVLNARMAALACGSTFLLSSFNLFASFVGDTLVAKVIVAGNAAFRVVALSSAFFASRISSGKAGIVSQNMAFGALDFFVRCEVVRERLGTLFA